MRWETYATDTALAARRFSETRTLYDDCDNFNNFEVASPSSIYSGPWSTTTIDGRTCFYKAPMEYTGYKFHLTSRQTITPTSATDLVMLWKRHITTDQFKVYVSTSRTSFPATPIAAFGGESGWTEEIIPLSAYAGQALYLRLEFTGGSAYSTPDAGIWIDSILTRETVNPELEIQPIHDSLITAPATPGTYRFAATLTDLNGNEHGIADELTLTVTSPFTFQQQPDGTLVLAAYTGTAATLAVPAEWDGRAVTAIAAGAFANAPNLTTLTLPSSITSLGQDALAASTLRHVHFRGAAPAASTLFGVATPTVYFTSGSTGFGSSYAGRPAVLWNPVITDFKLDPINGPRLDFSAHTHLRYVLEYTRDLAQQTWEPLVTNSPASAAAQVSVPSPDGSQPRFFRLRALTPE